MKFNSSSHRPGSGLHLATLTLSQPSWAHLPKYTTAVTGRSDAKVALAQLLYLVSVLIRSVAVRFISIISNSKYQEISILSAFQRQKKKFFFPCWVTFSMLVELTTIKRLKTEKSEMGSINGTSLALSLQPRTGDNLARRGGA